VAGGSKTKAHTWGMEDLDKPERKRRRGPEDRRRPARPWRPEDLRASQGNFRPTREQKRECHEPDGERFPRAESYTRGSTIWQTPRFGKYIEQTVGDCFVAFFTKFLGWQVIWPIVGDALNKPTTNVTVATSSDILTTTVRHNRGD